MVIVEPSEAMARVGEAMNTLNAIAERYPDAISLAAGRPAAAATRLGSLDEAVARVGELDRPWQYGPTAGTLTARVARVLGNDEGLAVTADDVVMTTGAQEAMYLVLATLFDPGDVLVVPDPTYVGITGAAALARVPLAPVTAPDVARLTAALDAIEATGRRARALYLVPDYGNPLGDTLDADTRRALVELARARGLWLIEDSPYRPFDYDAPPPPTLAALAAEAGAPGVVIHLGTFAKALSPGLRLGFIAWPGAPAGARAKLLRAKSFVTVNTSPITEAIAAGLLAEHGDSLRAAARRGRALYRARRDALLAALESHLGDVPGVGWSRPAGGFFARVSLPFEVDDDAVERCARGFGVLFCPMSMFSPTGGGRRDARLSFSAAEPDAIGEGVARFAAFVRAERPRPTAPASTLAPPRIGPAEALAQTRAALARRGLDPADADDVARALVDTSLRGVDTHGLRLLPTYLRALDGGRALARPRFTRRGIRPGVEHLDAGGALGVVAGLRAARRAVELAAAQGIGLVVVAGSNHFGAASVYTLDVAARGMIGLAMSNADPLIAPTGTRRAVLGTNPLSIAAPAEPHPLCLDMATSQIAWSRIRAEWDAHERLPPGWARDAEGRDCAEPGAGPPTTASPLGGYKGAGLALAIEVLCAGLSGDLFGHQTSHLYAPPFDTPRRVSHTVVAIDPAAVGEPAVIRARISSFLGWYRGQGRLVVPGDLEAATATRRRGGIPLEPAVRAALAPDGMSHDTTNGTHGITDDTDGITDGTDGITDGRRDGITPGRPRPGVKT